MARPGKLFLVFICLIASMVIVAPLPKAHATSNCATASNGQTQPTGYVTESPSTVTLGSSVSFTAHYTGCITASVQWVQICFGDGNCDTVPGSDTHTYANTGTYSWTAQLFNQNSVAPTNPGSNGALSGQVTVSPQQWTNGDWSIGPAQTENCINYPYHTGQNYYPLGNYCEAMQLEVKADGQEVNSGQDYFTVTMRIYNYNSSILSEEDYDATISFAAPSSGGVDTEQPQPQFATSQQAVGLTFPGVSVSASLLIPYEQIDCRTCNLNTLDWHVYSLAWCCRTFSFYAEHGAIISLPESQAWTMNFQYQDHMVNVPLGTTFSMSASINIPAGHQDPPPCSPNPCQQPPPNTSPDYEMLTNPSSISLPQASNSNSTVYLTSQYGFSSNLGLATSVAGPGSLNLNFASQGSTWTGNSANVMLPSNRQANITLNIAAYSNTPPGTYTVTVSSNGPPAHSVTVTITVSSCSCDFSISASPGSLVLNQASSGLSGIQVTSVNGFLGGIPLSTSAPSGISVSLSSARCAVPSGGSCTSNATISTSTSIATGTYTVTITSTASDLLHSVSIAVHVAVILSNNPSSTDWTILKGTWTEKNGVIDATTSSSTTDPIMRSTSTFASDRTVTVRAITITAGSNAYNTAWIGGKYVDSSNSIIMILHTDGKVELQFKQNGVQSSYTTGSTGLSPFVWHTFQMVFSGNTVNAYVDGTLYLTVTNSLVGRLGAAHISLESHGAPESQFDSATIT